MKRHGRPEDSQKPTVEKKFRIDDPNFYSPQPSTSSFGQSPTISKIKRQHGRPKDSLEPIVEKKLKSDGPNLTLPQPSTSSSGPSLTAASSNLHTNQYEAREGTVDHGGDYEYLMCALLALNLYFDKNIKDFSISNNVKKFEKFDDVVVEITYENDEKETIAIQLKYISRSNKNFKIEDFQKKGKFNIVKYNPSKELCYEHQNIKFLLYTNGVGDLDSIKQFVNKTNPYTMDVNVDNKNEEIFNNVCNKEGQKLRFTIISKDVKVSQEECESFKNFINNLYFCINQYSVGKLNKQLQTILSEHFKHINTLEMSDNFCKLFELWSKIPDTRFKILKSHIAFKLGIISLSPYVPSRNQKETPIESEKHVKLLKEAFSKFNITMCNTDSNLVSTMWKTDFTQIDYNDLSKIFLNLSNTSQENLPWREKSLLLWIQSKAPLVLKFGKNNWITVKKGIQLCTEYDPSFRFILCAPVNRADVAVDFQNIWENLSDLNDNIELLGKIIQCFTLKLDQRGPFKIEEIFGSETTNLKAITVGNCISSLETDVVSESNESLIKNYIPRKLPRVIVEESLNDITEDFVIVGRKKKFAHQNRTEVSLVEFLNGSSNYDRQDVIITTENSINDFSRIKSKCSSFYYFEEIDEDTLEWIASYEPSTLIEMKHGDSDCIPDTEFFKHFRNDMNIILADPGMGKTILMDYFFNTCPANYWPIKVIVRQHFKFLNDQKNFDVNLIIDYLIENVVNEKWQKYAKQLKSNESLIILWDGLDEYPSKCLDNLIQIISTVREQKFKQVVTARKFLKEKLEREFKISHLTLFPFDEKEQIDFIEKSLKETKYTEDEKINIKKVIVDSIGIKRYRDILGIPLQLYLYVEVYISKYFDKLIDINNLSNIYKQFIDGKIEIVIKKKELNDRETFRMEENFKEKELIKYQKAAVTTKFDDNLCQTYGDELNEFFKDIKRENFENGIIMNFTDENQPLFFHETMAEYLIASFLKENWQNTNENVKSFIDGVFSNWFTPEYQTIRYFFDLLMAEGHPLHIYGLNQDYDKILQSKENFDWNECDEGKRSVLHLVCTTGQKHPDLKKNKRGEYKDNKFKLEFDKNYEELVKYAIKKCSNVQLKDEVLKMTCLEYALNTKALFEMESILREDKWQGTEFTSIEQEQYRDYLMYYSVLCNYYEILKRIKFSNINLEARSSLLHLACRNGHENVVDYIIKKGVHINIYGDTITHLAAKKGHLHLVILFIKNGVNVNHCDENRKSILHSASESGNLEMVKFLLERGADMNQCDRSGCSILHSASGSGSLEMVKFLLERGADINHCKNNGWSIMHSASASGNVEMVKFLLERGADINHCNNDGWSILHSASASGNLEMVKFFVERGADINVCDNKGQSILYLTSKGGNLEIIKFLVERGADINHCDNDGWSILHSASRSGNLEMVKFLVERGVDTNVCGGWLRESILHSASGSGNLEMVKFLVKRGADINHCKNDGWSILHSVSGSGNLEIVKFLVERGADINACGGWSRESILHSASVSGNLEMIKFLVERGANVNQCDNNGESILHSASGSGNLDMAKFLVERGADINVSGGILGESILHSASRSGNLEMVKFMVERGADINHCDGSGCSILHSATGSGNLEMVKFLLERGADINVCNINGESILHLAYRTRNLEMIKFLVERGVDINQCNKYGKSILHLTSESGNLEMVKFLVEKGVDINQCNKYGSSMLHYASQTIGNLEIVKFLVGIGADINLCDNEGSSILHYASQTIGNLEIVKFLIGFGADIKQCNKNGASVLHYASQTSGNLEIVKFLVGIGANINHCNKYGSSILHYASVKCENLEIVKFLVQNGADVYKCNDAGQSVLDVARINERFDIVEFLEHFNT